MKASVIVTFLLSAAGAVADSYWGIHGTTAADRPDLAGTVLVDEIRQFDGIENTGKRYRGTLQDRVVQRTVSGTLDFYYKITVDSSSTTSVSRVVRKGFDEVPTGARDVNWRIDGLGTVGPDLAYRQEACCFETIFDSGLKPGESSKFVFIGTGTTRYDSKGSIEIHPVSQDKSLFIMPGFSPTT
jgi:hypothetical protein